MEKYSVPGPMKKLGDLFTKYKEGFKAPQKSVEREFIAVVKEVTGFELQPEQVSYTVSTKTISLHLPSLLKSELKFKQAEILEKLTDRLEKKSCPQFVLWPFDF